MADTGNIILIGMPGSGKSTVGQILAKELGWSFADTDALVEARQGRTLQAIVDTVGPGGVLEAESREARNLDCRNTVIATGGSMVYSEAAMRALHQLGTVIWLDVPLATLGERVGDGTNRGLAMRPGQDLGDLAAERLPLYRRYADIRIDCSDRQPEQVVAAIVDQCSVA